MTPDQVITHFKGERQAAEKLGLTRQTVNYWKQQGKIPVRTQALIQINTRGKLKAEK